MFTGIIEIIGFVHSLTEDPSSNGGTILTISKASQILTDAHIGDSISINGTCLTITSFSSSNGSFTVGLAPETLRRTNLGLLQPGSPVNLERATSHDTRFGGHFVQGHVDCTAKIVLKEQDREALNLRFKPVGENGGEILRYVVEKGYVCIDGASLTVTKVDDKEGVFGVMLIAHTQENIVTSKKEVGDLVNVEVDMVGKYIEKQLESYLRSGAENRIEKIVEKVLQRKLIELRDKES